MSDRAAVLVAAVLAAAAWFAVSIPLAAVLAVVAAAGVARVVITGAAGATAAVSPLRGRSNPPSWRRGLPVVLLVLAVAMVVSDRADGAVRALEEPTPPVVEGVATLVSDPERQRYGTSVILSIGGRRYAASAPDPLARELRDAMSGDRVVLRGRTGQLRGAPRSWVLSRHLAGRLTISALQMGPPAPAAMRAANAVRRTIAAGAASFSDDRRPVYLGMVVGDDRGQSPLTEFRFRASGLTHVLVVSGQNVAFLLVVAAPLRRHLPRRSRVVAGLGLLVMFVLVTRADPSVLRASVMAGIVIVVAESGRVAPGVRVLSMAVAALVIVDPLIVRSLGFQLSVAATTGLLVGTLAIAERLRGPESLRAATAITVAAQVATAPLLLGSMGWLSPSAVLTNLLAGPAAGAVMMIGATVGPVAGLVHERLAAPLMWPARVGVWWVDAVAAAGARLPLAALGPGRVALLVLAVAVVVLARRSTRWRRAAWLAGLPLAAAVIAVPPSAGTHHLAPGLELVVGDCGGRVVVVDGWSGSEVNGLEAVWRSGIRTVDVVVASPAGDDQRLAFLLSEQFAATEVLGRTSQQVTAGGVAASVDELGAPRVFAVSCTVER